jgi:23S rRNA (pseudouridine1915-N3)-methyltransferase
MRFFIVAVGHRMPVWVDAGFAEYAGRMPREMRMDLIALKPASRGGGARRAIDTEGERMLAAVPAGCTVIALDERGAAITTMELARRLARWRQSGRNIAFLIGGADGLAESVKRSSDAVWSLSRLTLPHGLARVLLAEQLYRAGSILHNHPYHRE